MPVCDESAVNGHFSAEGAGLQRPAVKNKIRTRLGERNGLAALMTIVIICLIVFTPLAIILSSLAYELNLVYSKLQHNDTQFPTVVASLFAHLPAEA